MLGTTSAGNNTSGVVNPYIRAYKAGAPGVGTTHRGKVGGPSPAILGLPVIQVRRLTDRQLRKRIRASRYASTASLGRSCSLDIGAAAFKAKSTIGGGPSHTLPEELHAPKYLP
jgi:hypothetical protein